MKSTPSQEIDSLARNLSARGVECVLERFRLPASPRATPLLGFLAGSAAAFLLGADRPAASFLPAAAASILLWLDDRGFSPLDWIARKEHRVVLVVPGTPSGRERKAFFFGIPLFCSLTREGIFSNRERIRRFVHAAGFLLCAALCVASAGRLLRVWPIPLSAAAATGAALFAAAVSESVPRPRPGAVRNPAAGWMEPLSRPRDDGTRPFLLLYSGDPGEVTYFLARHRGELLRGTGVFLEFPPPADVPPAVAVREGPILPVRVDASLLDRVRAAGEGCGIGRIRETAIRYRSSGLLTMARGFRAVTLFRGGPLPEREAAPALSDREAEHWAREVLDRGDPRVGGTVPPSTGRRRRGD